MALFELEQDYENETPENGVKTFKDFAAEDIFAAFFNGNEHADMHLVDGKECLVILEESTLKEHSSHWEAGAKQNFDTGLYNAYTVLYIRAEDYGPKPKVGKPLILDAGTDHKRSYQIKSCEDESGVFRMIMERVRQ